MQYNLKHQASPRNVTLTISGATISVTWKSGGGDTPLAQYKSYRGLDSNNVSLVDSTTL
jgi:hypothetical protein